MNPSTYHQVVAASWKLVEEQGLRDVDVNRIAAVTGLSVIEICAILPDQKSILLLLIDDVLTKIQITPHQLLSEQDYLFDMLMQGFDQAEPYKLAIQKMWNDLKWKPWILLPLLPTFQNKLTQISASLSPKQGILYPVFTEFALRTIFVKTFLTWIEDETLDLSKTMATLDQSLKQYSEFQEYFV